MTRFHLAKRFVTSITKSMQVIPIPPISTLPTPPILPEPQ